MKIDKEIIINYKKLDSDFEKYLDTLKFDLLIAKSWESIYHSDIDHVIISTDLTVKWFSFFGYDSWEQDGHRIINQDDFKKLIGYKGK